MNQPDGSRRSGSEGEHRRSSSISRAKSGSYKTNKKERNLKKKKNKNQHSKPFTVFMSIVLMIAIMVGFAAAGGLIGGYVALIRSIPDLGLSGIQPRTYTTVVYNNENKELSKLHGEENREYITIDKIPENMQNAIMAIEDERFYEHDGVDVRGLLRAAYSTLTGGQVQGGSTLIQQLIKNNITNVTRNTPKTKLKEQYLALKYEKELKAQLGSKQEAKKYIMELYLNTISFGHGYSGVQTAAQGYFGKDASELDLAECACLAGITNNPSMYSPRTEPENNKSRQTVILNYMLKQGLITQEEYDGAINEDIYSRVLKSKLLATNDTKNDGVTIHSYYEDALIDQISEDLQTKYNMSAKQANNVIYNGGLQIYSNYDSRIQGIVDNVMLDDSNFPKPNYSLDINYIVSTEDTATGETTNKEYKQFARSKAGAEAWVADKRAEIEAGLSSTQKILADRADISVQPQCSMAIIDYHTGEIKAIAGGRGEKTVNRGFNRATDSARQPGSVFKVLAAYAPAIDLGKITAASTIVDEPYTTADGYTPKNWWGNSYRGAVTPRTGIRDSMNVVAVKVMVETGIDLCYDYLLNFGFTTLENDNHAATALGGLTKGVTQVELAAAYGTLANQGQYIRPMFYDKVLDHDGNVLLENTKETRQVVKPSTGYIVTQLMTSVVKEGTGTAANFKQSNMPLAGKTGTTTDSKDLTFVGYTPYYVASIWYGYDRYDKKVPNMNGFNQTTHLKVWNKVMEQVNEGMEVKDFDMPNDVVKATVCKISGKLASSYCPAITDYFEKGTAVSTYCSGNHRGYSSYGSSSNSNSSTYIKKKKKSSYSSSGNSYSSSGSSSSNSSSTGGSSSSSDSSSSSSGSSSGQSSSSSSGQSSSTSSSGSSSNSGDSSQSSGSGDSQQ